MYAAYATLPKASGAHDPLALVEVGLRQQPHEPGREQPQPEREPGGDDDEIREHERVRALGLAVVLDRVGEGRPRHAERRQQEHHRRRDPHADLVEPDLLEAREVDEEEAVAEVDDDQRERGGHERDPKRFISRSSGRENWSPSWARCTREEGEVHRERAGEVADDHAERALLPHDDEEQGRGDRDRDVREAREHERRRPLLGPEQRRQLLVVHLRPDPHEAGAHEVRVVAARAGRRSARRAGRPPRARTSRSPS